MITASHNNYTYNGFKIAGINGEPIPEDWKKLFIDCIKCQHIADFLINYLKEYNEKHKKPLDLGNQSSICFALDTCATSRTLFTILK